MRFTRVAAWLIALLLVVALVAVIVWTVGSEPRTLALPTPLPQRTAAASPAATPAAAAATEDAAAKMTLPPAASKATATNAATTTAAATATPETPSPTPPPTETATETAAATGTATEGAENADVEATDVEATDVATEATDTPAATATQPAARVTATITATITPTAAASRTPAGATVSPAEATAATPAAPAAGDVITGVQIIELPAPTPTAGLPPGAWDALTDPNQMNDLAVIGNAVWIATSGGAVAWTKGSNTPVLYTAADGLLGNQLNAVAGCALPSFGVVFGGPTGLQIGDGRTGRWRHLNSDTGSEGEAGGGLRYDDVSTLYCDAENGFLIAGFAEHGIAIYDAEDDDWRYLDRNSGLAANNVRRVAVVGDRRQIWVASDEGVTVSAGADSTFYDNSSSPLAGDRVGALAAGDDGSMWLGGEGALYHVEGEDWTVYTADEVQGDFPSALITGLAFAPDGSLWLGASDATVCRFDPEQERCADYFSGAGGMAPGPLTNLVVDAGDNEDAYSVYYTTAGNGYAAYDGRAWRTLAVPRPPLSGNRVKALAVSAGGNLWAATEAGVQQVAATGESAAGRDSAAAPLLFDAANSGISPLGVQTLQRGADDGIWVGGRQGAAFYDGEEWQAINVADGLAGESVQAITVDGEGRTWLGGDRGVSIWNGSSFFVIDARQGLPSEDIRALAAEAGERGGVWIGTAGGGLYRFEGSQLQLFNARNVGLPSDTVTALAMGNDGALWIGTDRGLAQLAGGAVRVIDAVGEDPIAALGVTAAGDVWAARATGGVVFGRDDRWTELGVADGLPSTRITAIATDGERVWLGGQDGGIAAFAVNEFLQTD